MKYEFCILEMEPQDVYNRLLANITEKEYMRSLKPDKMIEYIADNPDIFLANI